jgi:voltage-gated potassium channel
MTVYGRWKFTVLLLALLLLLVVHPLAAGDREAALLYEFLLALVFVAALLFLFQGRRSRVAALVLGIPSLLGAFTPHLLPGASPLLAGVVFHLAPVVFLGYTVATILKTIFRAPDVSVDSVNGAFCGYLLIGVTFGHLCCLAEASWPGSFLLAEHVGPLPADQRRRHALLNYFSLITLTTVGYGDITPRSPVTRTLAWVEGVLGQFYVAVIVAALVALRVSAAIRDQPPDRPGS